MFSPFYFVMLAETPSILYQTICDVAGEKMALCLCSACSGIRTLGYLLKNAASACTSFVYAIKINILFRF